MLVRYKALGAAHSVTGSRHYFEIGYFNLLLDCGLFQGSKELRLRNWDQFPVEASKIHAIILSHAHIDHSGYLPKLVKEGFNGPIYCTKATADLLKIMLLDSAKLQEEEADWAFKKAYSKHERPMPLYNDKDAEMVFPLLETVDFHEEVQVNEFINLKFYNAGHILGAAITELTIKGDSQQKTIVYSGDLGRKSDPIMFQPEKLRFADILFVESTYGDRESVAADVEGEFARIIHETCEKGCLLIPAFSVGRTQNILNYLRKLMEEGIIDKIPVYIDSPMAISVTDLYKSYSGIHKLGINEFTGKTSLFDYPQFNYIRNREQSAGLNEITSNAIIISASGMCTGGRILHHLYHRLQRENDTVILVGYQAEGSRGRSLEEGRDFIKIFGQEIKVKCKIELIRGLSAHADQSELFDWLSEFTENPKNTFFVHGEAQSSQIFAKMVEEKFLRNVTIPFYLETFELFNGI